MSDLERLAITIRDRREELDYTQSGLSTATELDASYISKIENNQLQYPPSRRAIASLAQALELDEYTLMLMAGHIPHCVLPLVCQFLLIEGAVKIMQDAIETAIVKEYF